MVVAGKNRRKSSTAKIDPLSWQRDICSARRRDGHRLFAKTASARKRRKSAPHCAAGTTMPGRAVARRLGNVATAFEAGKKR